MQLLRYVGENVAAERIENAIRAAFSHTNSAPAILAVARRRTRSLGRCWRKSRNLWRRDRGQTRANREIVLRKLLAYDNWGFAWKRWNPVLSLVGVPRP